MTDLFQSCEAISNLDERLEHGEFLLFVCQPESSRGMKERGDANLGDHIGSHGERSPVKWMAGTCEVIRGEVLLCRSVDKGDK
jgi:hypothetical protein